MATTVKNVTRGLRKFVAMRNASPHQSNMQFQIDAQACGVWDEFSGNMPTIYRNAYGAAYIYTVGGDEDGWVFAEVCGYCGIGKSTVEAFKAACRPGVDPAGMAKEIGFDLDRD